MIDVIGVSFNTKGKIYYFLPGKYILKKNVTVIVPTEKGLQFGKVIENKKTISEDEIKGEIKTIIRISTKKDYQKHLENISLAKEAVKVCKAKVKEEKLNMQIIDASYTFDRSQLMFRFISDNRVDFRNLVKELASIYKTRIELHQVGVRDKAKEIGGYGLCGRCLCCTKFLNDLDSVSINMAKNQNISLNPNKINGLCGRLLCCLKYENECYSKCKLKLPRIGSSIKTKEGTGVVVSVNILKESYKVSIPDVGIVEVNINEND